MYTECLADISLAYHQFSGCSRNAMEAYFLDIAGLRREAQMQNAAVTPGCKPWDFAATLNEETPMDQLGFPMWTVHGVKTALPDVEVWHMRTKTLCVGLVARISDARARVFFADRPEHVAQTTIPWTALVHSLNTKTPLVA